MTIQAILKFAAVLLGVAEGAVEQAALYERLLSALDSALGELARTFPLQARCRIQVVDGVADLPAAVLTPRALLQKGVRVPLQIEDGKVTAEDGSYTLVYYRTPPMASAMDRSAILPYPEDLLRALPFYCAAFCVMGEDQALYLRLMEQYNTKLASALGYRPAAMVEAEGSI